MSFFKLSLILGEEKSPDDLGEEFQNSEEKIMDEKESPEDEMMVVSPVMTIRDGRAKNNKGY